MSGGLADLCCDCDCVCVYVCVCVCPDFPAIINSWAKNLCLYTCM